MPCVGFEHTIPAPEREKTVHALDRSGTVTDQNKILLKYIFSRFKNESLFFFRTKLYRNYDFLENRRVLSQGVELLAQNLLLCNRKLGTADIRTAKLHYPHVNSGRGVKLLAQ
jgi:hypothetical protein